MDPIYFDHNASTPLEPEVISKMKSVLENNFGNPSSTHIYGIRNKEIVEESRDYLAKMINADVGEIIFTSGGSESNNMAITGIAEKYPNCHIITSAIEHPSVEKVCDYLEQKGHRISRIPVTEKGIVKIDELRKRISSDTKLITIMLANNETGAIQPLKEICEIAQNTGIIVHTDAAQAAGKIEINVQDLGVDLMTIAAHKMNGPKGIGALYIRKSIEIGPMIRGASHERGLRAGTENVLEISGLGIAAKIYTERSEKIIAHQIKLRDLFYDKMKSLVPDVEINGDEYLRLPNTANLYFPDCNANTILAKVPEIAASAGAACHADSIEPSGVLTAMGCSQKRALGSIRFSFGRTNTENEIEIAVEKIAAMVNQLRGKSQEHKYKLSLKNSMLGCSCKLSPGNLNSVLAKIRTEQLSGNFGYENNDDASIYFISDDEAILSSVDFFSPIVEDPFDFGRIAAANALSDIYAMGGILLFANNIVAFPESKMPREILEQILQGAQSVAREAGIEILGGHSIKDDEVKFGMAVTGRVKKDDLLQNSGANAGDAIILTKPIGTGVLCQAMKKSLLEKPEIELLVNYMTALNKYSLEIIQNYPISSCTDVTGFGLIGHLSEMMKASGKSVELQVSQLPIMENVEKFARLNIVSEGFFGNYEYFSGDVKWEIHKSEVMEKILYDPQTSGGLLFSVAQEYADEIVEKLSAIEFAKSIVIGKVFDKKEKLIYIQ